MTAHQLGRGRQVRRAIIRDAARTLEGRGVVWSDWAHARGFDPRHVARIARGERPCERGESKRIADMMIAEAREAEGRASANARLAADIRQFVDGMEEWLAAGQSGPALDAADDVVGALHGMLRIIAPRLPEVADA